jgi:hypothetical protein
LYPESMTSAQPREELDLERQRTLADSLQNHLRTTLNTGSQIDELYVGADKAGIQCIIPVQAKGSNDRIGRAQLDQDIAYCTEAYPGLVCLPIAVQFMDGGAIPIFQLTIAGDWVQIIQEKHCQLVQASEITGEDLGFFRHMLPNRNA